MKRWPIRAAACVFVLIGFAHQPAAQAQVPHKLNYQGFLTDSTSQPLNATVTMVVKLYNVVSGGAALYTESHSVTAANGVFTVVIGSVTPLVLPFDIPYFLGVTVGADAEMTPRQPVSADAYALRAGGVDSLAALPAAQITGTVTSSQIGTSAVALTNINATGAGPGKFLATDGAIMAWTNGNSGTVSTVTAGSGLTGGGTNQTSVNLAVANGGITQNMLSASGGTANQVLSTNGTGTLQWVNGNVGTVTNIGTGSGLSGGPITGSGTINLAPSNLLPLPTCAIDQIAKWNGSVWVCSANYAGSGSAGGPATTALALAANGNNCPAGQFAAGVDAQGNAEGCTAAAGGTVTGVTASAPLASSGGNAPNISLTGALPAANGGTGVSTTGLSGNVLRSNGSVWTSAAMVGLSDLGCTAEGDVAVLRAGVWTCRSALPRFVDNGDQTVTDNQLGLMWEKKLVSTDVACTNPSQASRNVRCQQNIYNWSAPSSTDPTGTLYTDFLDTLNDLKLPNDGTATTCFAGYCDWRIPTIGELRSILSAPNPNCSTSPCISATFGPTQASWYWSSSPETGFPGIAWLVTFINGFVDTNGTSNDFYARAVRRGR